MDPVSVSTAPPCDSVMQSSSLLPAGPSGWNPLVALRVIYDPERWLPLLARRHGDPFTVRSVIGTTVVTGDPRGVREIFTADPALFGSFGVDLLSPLIGEGSLLLKSGAAHRTDRRLLTPPFHGARMRAYGRLFQDIARRHAAAWPLHCPFDVQDTTQAISMEAILRAVFGVLEDERVRTYQDALRELVASFHPLIIFFRTLRRELWGLGPWARFLRARAGIDALILEEIARRRLEPAGADRQDILALMLQARYEDGGALSAEQVRDHLMTLLFAGHETTALSLAWAFYWLHRHPEVRHRLLTELAPLGEDPDPDALAGLPYLEAVCHETLRLHPVIPVNPARLLLGPMELLGRTLPAGISVSASAVLLHQREELYPEPRAFRPERFLGRTYSPFEYIPFGGGARRCIGAAFALYEMKVVLATLLPGHRLDLVHRRAPRTVRRNFSMGPRGGVKMVLHGRE